METQQEKKKITLKTIFIIVQVLFVLALVAFVLSIVKRGFFTTYLMAYGVLVIGIAAGVISLFVKKPAIGIIDILLGIAGFGTYLFFVNFIF